MNFFILCTLILIGLSHAVESTSVCNLLCKRGYSCKISRKQNGPVCVPNNPVCPVFPDIISICLAKCSDDSNCDVDEKCCSQGCLRDCFKSCPKPVCPSRCRFGTYLTVDEGNCNVCKCAPEPCITDVKQCKCDIGVPVLRAGYCSQCKRCSCDNPCQFQTCPSNQICVNTEVTCVRAPCRLVAQCVDRRCPEGIELSNVFCGRGPTRQTCPASYFCNIAPNDAYAVCCPKVDPCKYACKSGERCVLQEVQCIKAPCLPVTKCLPECPLLKCANECLDGYAYDKNGCRTCECFKE